MENRGNVLFASKMGKRPSVPSASSAKCPSADDADGTDGTDGVCSKHRFGDHGLDLPFIVSLDAAVQLHQSGH
jgi:hypothetical protein